MPNLMFDFVKGAASSIAPDSINSLVEQSKDIFDTVIGGAKTASGKYREIRNNGGFKKLVDSFFHRGDEFGATSTLGDDDDDFDAGTDFGQDEESSEQSKVLDAESMKGIMRGQVSAMYDIGGKQAEASAMTTSEIITTVNTRSSEILSSLSKINTNLSGISAKLDKLIELNTPKKSESYSRDRSIFGSGGGVTIGSAFDFMKGSIQDNFYLSMVKSGYSMIQSLGSMMNSGMMSKGELAGMGVGMLLPMIVEAVEGKTGKQSWLTTTKNKIDEVVANVQNDLLTKLFSWDKFKNLFGDITKRTANQNYGSYVENQYNREKATFDGMTRTTIINVIPGYLKKITQALTGTEYHVSSEGYLTTDRPGNFKDTFKTSLKDGMSSKTVSRLMEKNATDISPGDLDTAQRILISVYVGESLVEGININSESLFKNGGLPEANARAIRLLAGNSTKGAEYWKRAVEWIMGSLQMDSRARGTFTRALNSAIQSTDNSARTYAKSATYVADIGRLDRELQDQVIGEYIGNISGRSSSDYDDQTFAGKRIGDLRQYGDVTINDLIGKGVIKRSQVPKGMDPNSRLSTFLEKMQTLDARTQSEIISDGGKSIRGISLQTVDYVASIYDILNRGINVYAVSRNKPYGRIPLHKAKGLSGPGATSSIASGGSESSGSGSTETGGTSEPGATPTPDEADKKVSKLGAFFGDVREIISNPFEKMVGNIREDARYVKDRAISGLAQNIREHELRDYRKNMGDSDDDKHDQQIADAVLAAMQAAVADGDTKEDMGALSAQISEIKDPKLRSRLQAVVQGTLQRNGEKQPAKSRIGKILMWGFGLIRKFVSPLLKKAKLFVSKFFTNLGKSWVTKLGKTIFGTIMKSLKSSGVKIATGAKAMTEGIKGIVGNVGEFRSNLASAAMDQIQIKRLQRGETRTIGQEAYENAVKVTAAMRELKTVPGNLLSAAKDWASPKVEKVKENVSSKKENVSSKVEQIKDRFKESEFGKGFMSAFEPKDMTPKTAADKATTEIVGVLKSKDGGGGILGIISKGITLLGNIFKDSTKLIEEDLNKEAEASANGGGENGSTSEQSAVANRTEAEGGGENAEAGSGKPEMPSIDVPSASGGEGAAAAGGGEKHGLGFNIGKTLGGMSKILMGIGQAVLTVVMSMAGFKALTKLIMGILQKSLKPLNKAFQSIIKVLRPVVKTITSILKRIVGYVVEIVESVIKIIQPILEAIGPIIEQLMSVLEPILEMITGLVNILMVPLVSVMKTVVVPILQTVANTLEIILGVVQVGMGLILTVLGGILTAVGIIGKIFGAPSLYETGKNMIGMGTSMVSSGWGSIKSGFSHTLSTLGNALTGRSSIDQQKDEEPTTRQATYIPATLNGSPMDGVYANGNVYAGAGAQSRYGAYMNMAQRGCGPVALTDAYARRTGNVLDARSVAASMSQSGAYNTSNGTSVRGYMNASSALGMNLTAGGVTAKSLSMASPTNPITVVGSGPDFTTRKGNNHYMNVIGTSGGTAYVSNPMTGRIERRSASSLAASSLMGLYGSGDSPIEFSDTVQDALGTLKDIVGQLISIFTGENDTAAALSAEEQKQQNQKALQDAGIDLANMDPNDRIKLENEALALFKAENPKYSGESDTDYEKRFRKNMNAYLAKAATARLKESANTDQDTFNSFMKSALGEEEGGGLLAGMTDALQSADSSASSFIDTLSTTLTGNNVSVDGTGFYSSRGARLATDSYTPSVFEPDISPTGISKKSPLHEFFTHMNGDGTGNYAWSSADIGHWFRKRQSPNKLGQGSSGSDHSGIDFLWSSNRTPEIVATTGGTVRTAGKWDSSTGNTLIWRDSGGDEHHYYHMIEAPYTYVSGMKTSLNPGDKIEGGQIVGRVGSTGHSSGAHLHYTIKDGSSGEKVNPLTFFKWQQGEDNPEDSSTIVTPVDSEAYSLGIPVSFVEGNSKGYFTLKDSDGIVIGYAIDSATYNAMNVNARDAFERQNGSVYQYSLGKSKYYIYGLKDSTNGKTVLDWLTKSDGQRYEETIRALGYMDPNSKTTYTQVDTGESVWGTTDRITGKSGGGGSWIEDSGIKGKSGSGGHWGSNGNKSGGGSSWIEDSGIKGKSGGGGSWGTSNTDDPAITTYLPTYSENTTTTTISGSGDASSVVQQIPPLGNMNELMQYDSQSTQPVIVNRYATSTDHNMAANIDRILNHTFNVRSVQIESMLGDMLKMMQERNRQRKQTQVQTKPKQTMDDTFQNQHIPQQVERLSIG